MAHKTLINGTVYNIVKGKSLISGTAYNITQGKTLINGTSYNISFTEYPTALLYSDDWKMSFQMGNKTEDGKTAYREYSNFTNLEYSSNSQVPWTASWIQQIDFKENFDTTSLTHWFDGAYKLTGEAWCSDNVTNMAYAYNNCTNLTTAVCGNNVTNMDHAYFQCSNLTNAVCGENVIDMSRAYESCINLTTAICGPNVTSMSRAYSSCHNLTTAVCGPNVTNMSAAYSHCSNLTTAVCGENVISMQETYYRCYNLTSAVCGPNVTSMICAYSYCNNLKSVICGPNVITLYETYSNCPNIKNAYLYCEQPLQDIKRSFLNAINLNIYMFYKSISHNDFINKTQGYYNSPFVTQASQSWNLISDDGQTSCHQLIYTANGTPTNIFLYGVPNVAAAQQANGD